MQCPLCHTIDIGKIGTNRYYCWHCLMEICLVSRRETKMFYVEPDGSLVPVAVEQKSG